MPLTTALSHITHTVSNHRFEGFHGPQTDDLIAYTPVGLLIKFFMPFPYNTDWQPRTIFQSLLDTEKTVYKGASVLWGCTKHDPTTLTYYCSTAVLNRQLI